MVERTPALIVHDGFLEVSGVAIVVGGYAIFAADGLEHGGKRVGEGPPLAYRGRSADCRPDGLESDKVWF